MVKAAGSSRKTDVHWCRMCVCCAADGVEHLYSLSLCASASAYECNAASVSRTTRAASWREEKELQMDRSMRQQQMG